MKITKNIITMIMGTAVLFTLIGCGQEGQFEVREGFTMNLGKFIDNSTEINDVIGNAIDKYEETYGTCGKTVEIELNEYSFYSKDLDMMVSGLNYNYGDSCKVVVGVHPTSNCETSQVLWHELYHCCQDQSQHDTWIYDLMDLRDSWESEGSC